MPTIVHGPFTLPRDCPHKVCQLVLSIGREHLLWRVGEAGKAVLRYMHKELKPLTLIIVLYFCMQPY